jgi:LacI family transcriptional regulator
MKKVILIIDVSRASGRQFLWGIERYINTIGSWEVYIPPPQYVSKRKMDLNKWVRLKHVDGIIVRDSPYLQNILSLDIPKIVFESKHQYFPGITTINSDFNGISEMAAEYFIGLGFKNFAYCGFFNIPWSMARFQAYERILKSNKDFRFFNYNCRHGIDDIEKEKCIISEWLKTLPRPLCVFACNDERGVYVLEACKIAGLKVPEEIAVLGIDNDVLMCKLSSPPLSSIKIGFEKAGFDAAGVLDKQMNGDKSVSNITITAKAQYLIKRRSSDVLAVEDADLTKALIFIRENFKQSIQVKDVVNATSLARRKLELRFNNLLKRSINDEINRLRIEHIKIKLMNSRLPICKIAESLEYTDAEHIYRFFKKITSLSPNQYRQKYGNM